MKLVDNNRYPCTCGSSDGRRLFPDGKYHCFVCKQNFDSNGEAPAARKSEAAPKLTPEMIKNDFISRGFEDRLILKSVAEFFKVKVGYDENGQIESHYYPYDAEEVYKCRTLPKEFSWVKPLNGKASDSLFGYELFSGGGRRVIITEGELDAMSVATASWKKYGKIYPVVAMSSAAMTKSLIKHREWLRSFGEIILCLDDDEAGKVATTEAIKILGVDKVKVAKLPLKDPSCVLTQLGHRALLNCIYEAAAHIPSGIITKEEIWDRLANKIAGEITPFPPCLQYLNTKLEGIREHWITLFTSGTGCGKTTMFREIELWLQETTESRIGIIHLEEPPEVCAKKLVKLKMNKNMPSYHLTPEEMKESFDEIFKDDRLVLLDHQGALSDGSIMDKLEYMCLSGCKYILLDHITILVSEGIESLIGNAAQDKLMSDLLKLVNKYPVWIGIISHLRKTGNMQKSFESGELPSLDDLKGSGAIKQISMDIVAFGRNTMAEDLWEKNTIKTAVLKARETGDTGGVLGEIIFDTVTGRLHDGMFYRRPDVTDLDGDLVESTAVVVHDEEPKIVEVK